MKTRKADAMMASPPLPKKASPTNHVSPSLPSAPRPLTADSTSSHFADSGLGLTEVHTPSPKRSQKNITLLATPVISPLKTSNSISSRLEQLAALAWEAEEDDRLDERTRTAVQSQLHAVEAQLEGRTRGNEQTSSDVDLSNAASDVSSNASSVHSVSRHNPPAIRPHREEELRLPDLNPVLSHLHTTLASMRTRLSESKHLHSLTMLKLSSVAQANVKLTSQLTSIRKTNISLSHANAALRMHVDDLEATNTQQAVAVSAMTGAVAGLESYVASSTPSTPLNDHAGAQVSGNGQSQNLTPNTSARRSTAVRGSGRFRGKYPISSPPHPLRRDSADVNMNRDAAQNDGRRPRDTSSWQSQTELQEGILAWVRGFRDVESGWRDMNVDVHRTPTRFGNGNVTEIQDTPMTPTRPVPRGAVDRSHAPSRSEEESVLLQGDKVAGSDIFGQEDDFGEFQTVASND